MLQESNDLTNNGIIKSSAGRCSCGGSRYIYRLPKRLGGDILPFIEKFGTPAFDFEATCLLKLETPKYIISGVKRLKEIRFVLKDVNATDELDRFEAILVSYIESTKGTQ